ncbi:MAG: hypothetical protein ACOYUZ_05290 [Patescibacteria group bacterium]
MPIPVSQTRPVSQSLPHKVQEKPSDRPSPKELENALNEFGHKLVMRASDECRVLPHILRLIGKGGEHIVFEDLRYPNYVLKVDFIESLPVLYAQAKDEDAIEKSVRDLHQKAKEHGDRIKRLQSYFSSDSVPTELVCVKYLPLNQKIVKSVLRDRNIEIPKKLVVPESMPVLCTLQHKIDLPKKEDRVDLYSSYAELNRTISIDNYSEGHRLLAGAHGIGPAEHSSRLKIILSIYPSLKKMIDLCAQDNLLKASLADYAKRAMKYSVATNEIIDMAGGGNVMFLKLEHGGWNPFLMDALSPPELNFDLIRKTAAMIKHEQDIDVRTKANTLNVINYIRFANALAIIAQIPNRLEVRGMTDIPPHGWHNGLIIEKYLDVYTPKKKTDG